MVKKIMKCAKFMVCVALIAGLVLPSFAANQASDGSAFVTKEEFDKALGDFNARLSTFEAGINSKIDSQVTSYLDRNGIWNGAPQTLSRTWFHADAARIGSYDGDNAETELWKEWNITSKAISAMTRVNDYEPGTSTNLNKISVTIGSVENTSGWLAFNQSTTWLDCYNLPKGVTRGSSSDTYDTSAGIWFKANKSGLCFIEGVIRQGMGQTKDQAYSFVEVQWGYAWSSFGSYGPSISNALGYGLYLDEYPSDNFKKRSEKISSTLLDYVNQTLVPDILGVNIHNYTINTFGVGRYVQIPTYDRPVYGKAFVTKDRYYVLNPATWSYDYANRIVWCGLTTKGWSTKMLSLNQFNLDSFVATVY